MLCLPRKARATTPAKMRMIGGWVRNQVHHPTLAEAMNNAAAAGTVTVSKAATCEKLTNSECQLQH